MFNPVRMIFATLLCLPLLQVVAQEAQTPHQVVENISRDVLQALQRTRPLFDENPDAYYSAIDEAVAPAVDFERMAFLVMGQRYYPRSTPEQRRRFVSVFRKSLVETYARGLLGVKEADYSISEPRPGDADANMVSVTQTLMDDGGRIRVEYSMRRGADGKWLLVNVIIEGINLGSTFRNQFAQLASRYNEDLDKVIANWSPEEVSG